MEEIEIKSLKVTSINKQIQFPKYFVKFSINFLISIGCQTLHLYRNASKLFISFECHSQSSSFVFTLSRLAINVLFSLFQLFCKLRSEKRALPRVYSSSNIFAYCFFIVNIFIFFCESWFNFKMFRISIHTSDSFFYIIFIYYFLSERMNER